MDEPIRMEQDKRLDPSAWVDQYGDYLYRYAYSRLRNQDEAEEVVQETFLAALKHAQQYAGTGAERAWLLGILKRKVIDHVRARQRSVNVASENTNDITEALFDQRGNWSPEVRASGDQSLDSVERGEFWGILERCLQTLPSRQADAFVLREMDEKTTEDISKELAITASNVWVLLHRARLRLATCMKRRWKLETD